MTKAEYQVVVDLAKSMGVMVIYLFVIVGIIALMMTITNQPTGMPRYENPPEPPKRKIHEENNSN